MKSWFYIFNLEVIYQQMKKPYMFFFNYNYGVVQLYEGETMQFCVASPKKNTTVWLQREMSDNQAKFEIVV